MPCVPSNFLIFVTIELLDAKTQESMHPIKYIYIYIFKAKVKNSIRF